MEPNIKLTINGKDYEVDLDKALKQGLIKPVYQLKVGALEAGDVFRSVDSGPMLIVHGKWSDKNEGCYLLLGRCGLHSYSCMPQGFLTKTEIEKYLIEHKYFFIKNINNDVVSFMRKY